MEERKLMMSDDVVVYATIRMPKTTAIGHIHILHGMAEHSGRYDGAAEYFVERGYIVTAHDHRGHGQTASENGKRGHFGDRVGFDRVVKDVQEVVSVLRKELPTVPFILFGHSMGSFIARRYIQLYGDMVDRVVLSGTGDDNGIARYGGILVGKLTAKMNDAAKENYLLDTLVFGSFNKGIRQPVTKFDWLSRNDTHVYSYMMDEYCGFVPTTQFFLDLFEGLGVIHQPKEIAKIPKDLPILLFSGTEDPVGNFSKAVWKVAKQYEKAQLTDVTVQFFEEGRHELLNDTERPEVIQQVLEWIEKDE